MIFSVIPHPPAGVRLLFSNRDIARLFIPLFIDQTLGFLIGLADSVMAAHIGEAAVSGVSLVDFIMVFLISVFAALATGGVVIAGQYLGRANGHKAREAADHLVWFVGLISICVTILLVVGKNFIFDALFGQISAEVHACADIYFSYVSFSVPAIGLYAAGAAIFRTTGNSALPMRVAILMGSLNILGNYLSLYVFDLGIDGLALATLISRSLGAIIIICLAAATRHPLKLRRSLRHSFKWPVIKLMLRIGAPYALENGLFNFGRVVVLSLVSTFGTASIAANAVAGNMSTFALLPGTAIGFGLTAIIARCVGAGDFLQVRYYTRKVISIVYAAHMSTSIIAIIIAPFVIRVYGLSEAAGDLTWEIMIWHGVFSSFVWPLAFTLPVVFRANGDVKYTMYAGVGSMCLCRLSLAYLLGSSMGMGVFGVWLAMFIDWIVRTVLFIWRYHNGKWTLHSVI